MRRTLLQRDMLEDDLRLALRAGPTPLWLRERETRGRLRLPSTCKRMARAWSGALAELEQQLLKARALTHAAAYQRRSAARREFFALVRVAASVSEAA